MIYDIFISYRRKGGFFVANHLNDLLVRDNYTVSFDIDNLREGDFDENLYRRIKECRDFLVIVDEHAFDRMVDPAPDYDPEKDWMRKEIVYALKLEKNIISVFLPDASYPKNMPADIEKLDKKNGPTYSMEYFEDFYKKLKEFLHSIPRNVQHLIHDSQGVKSVRAIANLKVKADLDCNFFVDGEEQEKLKAGSIRKFPLTEGQYELDFVSVENEFDHLVMSFEMPPRDTVLSISLSEKRRQRLEKEAAELEAKRKAFLQDQIIPVSRGLSIVMKPVEGGTFWMGAQSTDPYGQNYDDEAFDCCESPIHSVTLDSFYMGETVVTQALWNTVVGKPTSIFEGDNLPVEGVSWDDCIGFIRKLNRMTGKSFRLPTEAEWEYAARGGNQSNGYKYPGSDTIDDVAWYSGNSGDKTHEVKMKLPNELGIYDMSGNVWEWCQDWYDNYYNVSETNPKGPSSGTLRVLRGGCCCSWHASSCRVSSRVNSPLGHRSAYAGFRLVLPQ